VADLAGDVVAVLDRAGLARAHLMGASLGGMVAQELAIEHAERVDRLVLACTTPGWPYAYPMPAPSTRLMTATRTQAPEVALRRHVENSLSAGTVARRPELVERLVRHQRGRPVRPDSFAALAAAGGGYSGGLRQQRIQARTLVLHGDADRVVDPRNSALLAQRIPGARQLTLPGLGHLFFWEDPAAVVAAVTDFLTAT
jgi:3-oxoadipate enol-lactonase